MAHLRPDPCNQPGTGPAALNATINAGSQTTATCARSSYGLHGEGRERLRQLRRVGAHMVPRHASPAEIDEAGLLSGTVANAVWALGTVMSTLQWTSTIPAGLAPGNHLIHMSCWRSIMRMLPSCDYMECAQLVVTGSGNETPSGSYLVSFSGAVDINIYSSTATTYTIPGPAKWTG
ncbi:glycoside hydrolase family 61 protein [Sphaerosporella brunnea]|uniref:AA9 family lytic polysaccharide monooxygenase n=1 Tax=Sphaerosporella brunnea TaxID=1250544 RepID=A0A5J5EJA0_9PEZI|nr:glycoside hydrolase family 61 protein [Sphaerosporella brunnea]